jgi:ABC-type Fe3+ transport system substrate-binding protein
MVAAPGSRTGHEGGINAMHALRSQWTSSRLRAAITAILAAGVISSACGGGGVTPGASDKSPGASTAETSLAQLATLAKQEATLSFFTADGNDAVLAAVSKAFQEKYGVAITPYKTTNGPLLQRFLADSARGTPPDVLLLSTPSDMQGLVKDGYLAKYQISSQSQYPSELLTDAPYVYPYTSYPFAIIFNTTLAGGTDPSQFDTWDKVFVDKWRGRFGMPDPNVVGGAFNATWSMRKKLGDAGWKAFQEKLAKLQPRTYPSNLPMNDAIASGDLSLGWGWDANASVNISKGAPMAISYPAPTASSYGLVGVVAKAAHPNAARLFLDWFMSAEGQTLWTNTYGSTSTNTTVKPPSQLTTQTWYKPATSVVFAPVGPTADQRQAHLDEYNKIVLGK